MVKLKKTARRKKSLIPTSGSPMFFTFILIFLVGGYFVHQSLMEHEKESIIIENLSYEKIFANEYMVEFDIKNTSLLETQKKYIIKTYFRNMELESKKFIVLDIPGNSTRHFAYHIPMKEPFLEADSVYLYDFKLGK